MIRFFDIFFSSIAILILLPFMTPIVILLKLTGEHDIFYRQVRIGRYGKEFGLFKFATMLRNSPNLPGGLYTSKNDPRMLPLGKFLRKTKINELPQLINIFLGQMSVIGYRPTVREHFNAYPDYAKKKISAIRPGLSGIGSIVFRNEEELLMKFDNKDDFHQKIIAPYKAELECWFVDNRTLFTYFKLIFLTIVVVLKPSEIHLRKSLRNLPPIPKELVEYLT